MKIVSLHDKREIERFMRRNPFLHIYSIGDLDDFFWEHTVWYGLRDDEGQLREVVLLYTPLSLPPVLALTEPPLDDMRELLRSLFYLLPRRLYAHLTEGLRSTLEKEYKVTCHGTYCKMGLQDTSYLDKVDTSDVEQLSSSDLPELQELYRVSYPANSFDPRILETGYYYGVRREGHLVGVAGIHVYSQKYRVAALGNVTTHPRFRGQGIASAAVARLCQELLWSVDHIGLNVKSENESAVGAYRRLGFVPIATYEECTIESSWK